MVEDIHVATELSEDLQNYDYEHAEGDLRQSGGLFHKRNRTSLLSGLSNGGLFNPNKNSTRFENYINRFNRRRTKTTHKPGYEYEEDEDSDG